VDPNLQYAPLNILLADDDADDRLFFDKALKEIPIATNLTMVYDGEQLMNYLNENSEHLPDILFLDINMPRMNGIECLSEINGNKKLKDLTVIIFTISFTSNFTPIEMNLKNMLSKMGTSDFIRKSNDLAKLKLVIHNALLRVIQKRA